MRRTPLALAAGLLFGGGAVFAQAAADGVSLEPSRTLSPPPRGEAAKRLPIILRADSLTARPELEAEARGGVEFRRGGTVIRADRLHYDQPEDLARATGGVRIEREGAIYSGPELQLRVQRFEGFFLEPEFEFTRLGAGGRASRVDFLDSARARARDALYTSCPRDGSGDPAWVLQADAVQLDFEANEGIAHGAVLRFLGAPILPLPAISFPLTDARKSGWLPPSVNLDSRSGFEFSIPYYWNIAPNRDATITPRIITRRGVGADGEFRYLQGDQQGALNLTLLPNDRVAGRDREALQWQHDGRLGGTWLSARYVRVSDDAWWKDFPDAGRSLTPRLLASSAAAERPFAMLGGRGLAYARVQGWQVLQGSDDPVAPPFERAPQLGVSWAGALPGGFEMGLETEFNRFRRPSNDVAVAGRSPPGQRWHALGSLARPWRESGGFVVPRVEFNAARYRLDASLADGRSDVSRVIPTFSVDAGLELERRTAAFGRELRQTLEPRVLYVNTPYRAQAGLPNYDSAARDFNFDSVYATNPFSGVDRVADAHQLTLGATSRVVDEASGAEVLRLGLVQRVLLRDQRVAPNADGTPDGPPLERRVSDLLLLGSTTLVPNWTLDASLQYNPDSRRLVRSITGMRWSPGPYRTLATSYRLARGFSEQLELGWQWPIAGRPPAATGAAAAAARASDEAPGSRLGIATAARGGAGGCGGAWYSVGRVNYSLQDSRITDSLLGVEYDAGCWIGRVVAERLSTGRSEATTRLMLQLEFVGLSRIGSNPLKVLKDNIPGYRLLRDERRGASDPSAE